MLHITVVCLFEIVSDQHWFYLDPPIKGLGSEMDLAESCINQNRSCFKRKAPGFSADFTNPLSYERLNYS
jgi:hypothetical protein